MKTQSSELQRRAEEIINNEKRLAAFRMKTTINAYKAMEIEEKRLQEAWWVSVDHNQEYIEENDSAN